MFTSRLSAEVRPLENDNPSDVVHDAVCFDAANDEKKLKDKGLLRELKPPKQVGSIQFNRALMDLDVPVAYLAYQSEEKTGGIFKYIHWIPTNVTTDISARFTSRFDDHRTGDMPDFIQPRELLFVNAERELALYVVTFTLGSGIRARGRGPSDWLGSTASDWQPQLSTWRARCTWRG